MSRFEDDRARTLIWAESPVRELVHLAWPMALSMVSHSLMTLVDTLFVGRVGIHAIAAVGMGGITAFTILCFPMGLLGGVRILVAQATGADRSDEVPSYLSAGLWTALAMGLFCLGFGQVVALGLPFVSASEAGVEAQVYVSIRMFGAPLFLIFTAQRERCHGLGETRLPMVAVFVANFLNILFDWVLIIVFGYGVAGAAWATVASSATQPLVMVIALGRDQLRFSWVSRRRFSALWEIGAPSGLQFLLEIGAFTALTMMVAAFGELDMAAHQIALQIIHFSFLPAVAVGDSASVLSGQSVGARRDELVPRVGRASLSLAGGYALVCTVVLALFSPWLASHFTDDLELRRLAVALLYVAAVFQVFDAASIVARGTLKGAGDVRYTAFVGITVAWLTTPPLTWVFGFWFGFGALGGWIALCLEIALAAALFWTRLHRGGWRRAAERSRQLVTGEVHTF